MKHSRKKGFFAQRRADVKRYCRSTIGNPRNPWSRRQRHIRVDSWRACQRRLELHAEFTKYLMESADALYAAIGEALSADIPYLEQKPGAFPT